MMSFRKILTELCRIIIGITFMFSGIVKAIDPVGGALKFHEYLAALSLSSLDPLATFTSVNLSSVEFMMGLCILTAVYRRITTICVFIFMTFMTVLTLYLAIANPIHDCGCFGDALIITNWQTFYKNIFVLLPAAVVVFVNYKRMTPLYSRKVQWFIALFAYIFPTVFAYYNYSHEPIIDFRPYKTGKNIIKQMSFPKDAPQDVYEYIYEKNGEKKSFAPETSPAGDSTWTFVESKLIKQGYVPPITTFELYNNEGENLADEILADEKGVFLLIAQKLEKASDENTDIINDVYDYSLENGFKFYCVTSSDEEKIKSWSNDTGSEYPFLTADDVTLKTIVRSNPGLVLLKSGTVMQKWNHNDIPDEENLGVAITEILNNLEKNQEKSIWLLIICCFALPLLLVWVYDRTICAKERKDNVKM